MSEPVVAVIPPGRHHMHPAYVVLNSIRVVVSIVVASVASLAGTGVQLALSGGIPWWVIPLGIGVVVVLIAVTALVSYIYYQRYQWEITDTDIHIYSGIWFKKQHHIPFQRVQSIDFNASVIQRILGIVRLKIDTAGGTTAKGVYIPALKLAQAEAFRAEVFARKRGAVQPVAPAGLAPAFAPVAPDGADRVVQLVGDSVGGLRGVFADDYDETAPIECEYGLSAKELLLSAISGDHTLVLAAVLIGGLSQVNSLLSLFGVEDAIGKAASYAVVNFAVPTIVGAAIALVVVVYLLSLLGTALQYGGFKARRRGGRIEVEMGLLARQYRGVSVRRVQSVEIRQGAIRRLLGYAKLHLLTIDTLNSGQEQNSNQPIKTPGLVIHPFVKVSAIDGILHAMAPEYDPRCAPDELRRLPAVALRRVVIRHVVWFAAIYAVCAATATWALGLVPSGSTGSYAGWLVALIWVVLGLFVVGRGVGAVLWYRHAAYAYNSQMLTLRSGFFGITTTVIPRKRIQWADTHENPFQRLAGVASIRAATAAGIGGTTTKLRDLSAAEASAYLDWVRPRGAERSA